MLVEQWGLIDFESAWHRQRALVEAVLNQDHPDTLVLCEHPTIITTGRNTQPGSILSSPEALSEQQIGVVAINRGGEATVHSPGQLVGYPIFNLARTRQDLHWFLRTIEQCVIDTLSTYNILGHRVDGLTGVWISESKKICSIGIHCSRWITSHGFALNVSNDLSLFNTIIPCGITDRSTTSIFDEGAQRPTLTEVGDVVSSAFNTHFGQTPQPVGN